MKNTLLFSYVFILTISVALSAMEEDTAAQIDVNVEKKKSKKPNFWKVSHCLSKERVYVLVWQKATTKVIKPTVIADSEYPNSLDQAKECSVDDHGGFTLEGNECAFFELADIPDGAEIIAEFSLNEIHLRSLSRKKEAGMPVKPCHLLLRPSFG